MDYYPEPESEDETWGARGESSTSWLERSTLPRAVAARSFLNGNIAKLPAPARGKMVSNLQDRWPSAFFELIVGRTLQLLGASIEVEPESQTGPKVDFVAHFDDVVVNVEATVSSVTSDAGNLAKIHAPLLEIIERQVPDGWGVGVWSLPNIGLNESRRSFREAVARSMETVRNAPKNEVELFEELPQGELQLRFRPDPPAGIKLLHEAPLAVWNKSEEQIRKSVERKKRQVRAFDGARLVAIHANGLLGKWEDFEFALFGRSVMVLDERRRNSETRFDPDGVFATNRQEAPVVDGVLAYLDVGFRDFPEPVLFRHPRSERALPEPLLQLEQRILSPERDGILTLPSKRSGFLAPLGFVAGQI